MFCPTCGTKLADDSIFCHKCGGRAPSQSIAAETSLIDSDVPEANTPKQGFHGLDKVDDSDPALIPAATTEKRMFIVKRAWKGEERLWKVFWIFNVLGFYVIGFMQQVVISIESAGALNHGYGRLLTILFGLLTIIYFIWAITSLWRCAFNTGSRVWGYLGRVFVVAVIVSLVGIIATIASK